MSRRVKVWRYPDELRAKIAASPLKLDATAEKFDVDRKTVVNIRREFGVSAPFRGSRLDAASKANIRRLSGERLSVNKISVATGHDPRAVRRALEEADAAKA